MPELYAWNDDYSVGIHEIDQQHKKFFVMLNDLHNALSNGKGKEVMLSILDGVVSYTVTHFNYEQAEMQKCGYPYLEQHKLTHETFKAEALKLQQQARSGETAISIQVMSHMRNWLINHITKEDKRYAPYIGKKKAA